MFKDQVAHLPNKEDDARIKVELHELAEDCPIESRYQGTDTDRHDMIVLGRKQVLRVISILTFSIPR